LITSARWIRRLPGRSGQDVTPRRRLRDA